MKNIKRTIALAAIAAALAPAGASAQDHRFSAGWNAGGSYFTSMNAGVGSGSDIALDPGWILGVEFEQWFGSGRFGLRLNGALTERPLSLPEGNRSIGVWLADLDGQMRLLPAGSERRFNIFISAGAGLIQYRLGNGAQVAFTPAAAAYDGDDDPKATVVGGLGTDYMTGWSWDGEPIGIRFEVVDHVALRSPFAPLGQTGDFSPIHNVRFVIGVFTGFGVLR